MDSQLTSQWECHHPLGYRYKILGLRTCHSGGCNIGVNIQQLASGIDITFYSVRVVAASEMSGERGDTVVEKYMNIVSHTLVAFMQEQIYVSMLRLPCEWDLTNRGSYWTNKKLQG